MQKSKLVGKIIWITGASSGIGEAVLELFLKNKAQVIATSRNLENLKSLQNQYPKQLDLIVADVTSLDSVNECVNQIREKYSCIDIAFLNAGNCYYVNAQQFDVNVIEKNFAVNFFGLANCIQAVLPLLRSSKAPHLVGMTSSVAYIGLPTAEGYGASKAAARYLLQALQADLKPENIAVSIVCPGFVKTPLTDKNDFPMPFLVSAEKAAAYILDGIVNLKTEIAFPRSLIWTFKLLSFIPSRIRIFILAKLIRKS